jgi:hypothetical protein
MPLQTPSNTDAADFDVWFRTEVEQAIAEADAPDAIWIPHDEIREDMRRQRQAIKAILPHTRATCAK